MKKSIWILFILLNSIYSITSAQTSVLKSEQLAYITAEADDNLMIIDLKTEKTIATLKTGKIPHALVFDDNGKGYVNNRGSNILTVIDGNEFKVINNIQLPATSFQLAISPDKKILAVGYKDALMVSFIDTETDKLLISVPIGKEPVGTKIKRIKHPYWSKDGRFLYVGDNVNHTVVKINGNTFNIVATIPVISTVHHFVSDKNGEKLYVTHEDNASISVIDMLTNKVLKNIPIPLIEGEIAKGHHGAFDNNGDYFFYCNEGGKTVAIIDTEKMKVVKTLQAGIGAGHAYFTKDGKYAYIIPHKDNIVTIIDLAKQEVTKNIVVGKGKKLGHSAYFTDDGNYLYVINSPDNTVAKIDLKQQKVISTIPVGKKSLIMVVR